MILENNATTQPSRTSTRKIPEKKPYVSPKKKDKKAIVDQQPQAIVGPKVAMTTPKITTIEENSKNNKTHNKPGKTKSAEIIEDKDKKKEVVKKVVFETETSPKDSTDNSALVKKIIESFTPKVADKSRTDLAPLRAMEELAGKEPFNMPRFLDSIPLTGLSFLDLMQLSASARRKLSEVLRIVPKSEYRTLLAKCPSLQQLELDSDEKYQTLSNENPTLEPDKVLNLYMAKFAHTAGGVNTPRSSTHLLKCQLNNIAVNANVDSGCCLIAVKDDWVKRKQIVKTLEHSRYGLRAAQGDLAIVSGEIHNIVCEFGNIRLIFGAVVVQGLDCDVLLGRPFLELTRAITFWENSIYHFLHNATWSMVNGIAGVVLVARKLTNAEINNWTNGIVPLHDMHFDIPTLSNVGNTKKLEKTSDMNIDVVDKTADIENNSEIEENSDTEESTSIFYNKMLQMYPDIEFISSEEMTKEIEDKENKISILTINYSDNVQQSDTYMQHEYQTKADSIQDFFIKIQEMKNSGCVDSTGSTIAAIDTNKMLKLKKIEVPCLEEINTKSNSDVGVKKLKIASYNVNSIRNIMKKKPDELPKLFEDHNIVCLQEVRLLSEQIDKLDLPFTKDFSSYWSTCEEKKGYSSVATFIHKSLKIKENGIRHVFDGYSEESMEGRYLEIELENNVVIINVYFPNGRMPERTEYKNKFNNSFLQRYMTLSKQEKIVILSCDLNIAHAESDISCTARQNIIGNSGFENYEREWVDKLIKLGLIDTWRHQHPEETEKYTTWLGWKNARIRNIGMRFDYIFVANNPGIEINKANHLYDYHGSDHVPIETFVTIWFDAPYKAYSLYSPQCVGSDITSDDAPFQIDGICEDEFLKSLNIVQENGRYYKVVGNGDSEARVYIRPRRDAKPTPTEDFVVGDCVFQIATDAPQHAKDKMREVLQNRECFVQKGVPGRTFTKVPEVTLEFTPPPDYKYPYIGSKTWKPHERAFLDPWTEKMVKHSKLCLAPPPIKTVAIPVISTKGGKSKCTFNYRVNEHIVAMVYPISPVRDVLQFIALGLLLSGYDFSSAYEQNPLARASRWLTNILLPSGIHQFMVTPIGLKVSGEWFSYTVENVVLKSDILFKQLDELSLEKYIKLYRDDLTQKQDDPLDYDLHARVADRIMTVMDYHTGSFSAHKTFLLVQRWTILGYLVGNGEIIPTEEKVEAILKWPFPQNYDALLTFVGFIVFLNHCIHSPQHSMHVMTKLQKHAYKNINNYRKEVATNKAEYYKAFYTLKRIMAYRFSLAACDPNRPAILITDTDKVSTGGLAAHALDPKDDQNITAETLYTPFHIQSRKFTEVELKKLRNPEMELSGAVHITKKVRPHIGEEIYIMMDHKAWVILRNRDYAQSIRAKNMLAYLDSCSIKTGFPKFIFRKGSKHVDADIISRIHDGTFDIDGTTDIDTFLHDSIKSDVEVEVSMKLLTIGWEYDLIASYLQGKPIHVNTKKFQQITRKASDYFIRSDKLYRKTAIGVFSERMVPKYGEVHIILLEAHQQYGHCNPAIMFAMLAPRYYWDAMMSDINLFYNGCQICQQRRRYAAKKYQLYRILPPRTTMIWVGMDVLSLPKSAGFTGLFNVIDYGTSWASCYPVKTSATSRTFINHLENWMSIFGTFIRLFVDNASTFISEELTTWAAKKNIEVQIPSVGHSMGNAKIESFNYTITIILAKLLLDVRAEASKWMQYLPQAIKIYRVRVKRVQGLSPYQALFKQDYEPTQDFIENDFNYTLKEIEDLATIHHDFIMELNPQFDSYRIDRHNEVMDENNSKITPIEYALGDIVWLYNKKVNENISTQRKMDKIWKGPNRIIKLLGKGSYVLFDMIENVELVGSYNHIHLSKWCPPTNFLSYSNNRHNMFKLSFDANMDKNDFTSPCKSLPFKQNVIDKLENFLGSFDKIVKFEIKTDDVVLPLYGIDFADSFNVLIIPPLLHIKEAIEFVMKRMDFIQVTIIVPDFILTNDDELLQEMVNTTKSGPILIVHDDQVFDKNLCPLWLETLAWTFHSKNGGSAHSGERLTCTFDSLARQLA